jgi:molybdopterin-guanine dinucleotide biosynthesis protein A
MSGPPAPAGLVLLTGGRGRRFGGPKHLQPHPDGGTWGGHLCAVFETVFPGCPMQVLGGELPDRPGLLPLRDPRQGPAAALRHWAAQGRAHPLRWWIAPCDQPHWTPEALAAWHQAAAAADPGARHWVLARHRERLQPLGGFLADALVPRLPGISGTSLMAFVERLPTLVLDSDAEVWLDQDFPDVSP